jgi:hypothetical protein
VITTGSLLRVLGVGFGIAVKPVSKQAGALITDTRNSITSLALLLISHPIFRVLVRHAG